jgi:arsenite-transporting ATPase
VGKRAAGVSARDAGKTLVSARKADMSSLDDAPAPAVAQHPTKPRYYFFGGKGGVGKTTAAAAFALSLLDDANEAHEANNAGDSEQILLFSTDPAHSLSDSLDVKIGDRLTEVAHRGKSRLFAYEMDAGAALEKFKDEHRTTLAEIAERGTLLDEGDINELLDLSLPGMDEVMSLFELSELDRTHTFARVVVDTAPSGHTSRLLRLPEVFSHMIGALDLMAEKHRYIVAHFARGRRARADQVDLFINDLAERIGRVRSMLHDAARARFTLVTIPEAMAVEETTRYFALLKDEGVPVTDLIVNRIEHAQRSCPYCRARAATQQPWLSRIARDFKALTLRSVPLFAAGVRGLDALRDFSRATCDGVRATRNFATKRVASAAISSKSSLSAPVSKEASSFDDEKGGAGFTLEARRLLIFGGKGGVGKTTAACASALALARDDPRSRVLVFSTDPAHSLSDSFGERVGELKRGVGGVKNLDAMEIDPGARFEELKARFRAWTDELFASLTSGSRWEVQFDREAMRELVELAPPGIDEIAALSVISDLVDDDAYRTIVLDTAPTGHLIRFLELPEVALSWVRAFLKLLLKYKNVVKAGGVAEELIALSKSIKRIIALLRDAAACEFVGVAISERMSLEETARLATTLERLKVPMRRLLVNSVVPADAAGACDFCRARRDAQVIVLGEFRRRFNRTVELFVAPQQPQEIRGVGRLREHFAGWRELSVAPRARSSAKNVEKKLSVKSGRKKLSAKNAGKKKAQTAKAATTGAAKRGREAERR